MSRGVRRQVIFMDDSDYMLFLRLVSDAIKEFGFKLHSYCLMTNHFHLLIETEKVNISVIMEKILKSFANNFNAKYHYVGHVFQGPYKALLIDDQNYFLETGRYIHLNPVKARIVAKPENYPYSSYWDYVEKRDREYLTKDRTLRCFLNSDPGEYAKFVESKLGHADYEVNIMTGLKEDLLWQPL